MNEHVRNLSVRVRTPQPAPPRDGWSKPVTLNEVADDPPRTQWRPRIHDIRRAAAKHFGMTQAQMLAADQHRTFARARQIGMYLARKMTPFSFPIIGKHFGGRDHTTVMHGCQVIESLLKHDPKVVADVEAVRQLALKMDPMLAGGHE